MINMNVSWGSSLPPNGWRYHTMVLSQVWCPVEARFPIGSIPTVIGHWTQDKKGLGLDSHYWSGVNMLNKLRVHTASV